MRLCWNCACSETKMRNSETLSLGESCIIKLTQIYAVQFLIAPKISLTQKRLPFNICALKILSCHHAFHSLKIYGQWAFYGENYFFDFICKKITAEWDKKVVGIFLDIWWQKSISVWRDEVKFVAFFWRWIGKIKLSYWEQFAYLSAFNVIMYNYYCSATYFKAETNWKFPVSVEKWKQCCSQEIKISCYS